MTVVWSCPNLLAAASKLDEDIGLKPLGCILGANEELRGRSIGTGVRNRLILGRALA